MKSVVSEKPEEMQERKYPYLGVFAEGDIILFTAPKQGIWVFTAQGSRATRKIGEYSVGWAERYTIPYTGSVTLSND